MTGARQDNAPRPTGRFSQYFLERYERSLGDYRFFYDDLDEVGNPERADHAFYYVPGISGSPGQMRFALPSLIKVFGPSIHAKGLHIPDFSVSRPIWEKYTAVNIERKLERLRLDLLELLGRFPRVSVICSSNGLYDFLAAVSSFPPEVLETRIRLAWVSCAPDQFSPSRWEQVFYPWNGIMVGEHRWFAYPNSSLLRFVNAETEPSFLWKARHQKRRFAKVDIESRFHCLGFEWDYISSSQLGEAARHVIRQIRRPWTGPAAVLIASRDGYWQGATPEMVRAVVHRYIPGANCLVRPGSHVGVVNPTTLTEVFTMLAQESPPAAQLNSLSLGAEHLAVAGVMPEQ